MFTESTHPKVSAIMAKTQIPNYTKLMWKNAKRNNDFSALNVALSDLLNGDSEEVKNLILIDNMKHTPNDVDILARLLLPEIREVVMSNTLPKFLKRGESGMAGAVEESERGSNQTDPPLSPS